MDVNEDVLDMMDSVLENCNHLPASSYSTASPSASIDHSPSFINHHLPSSSIKTHPSHPPSASTAAPTAQLLPPSPRKTPSVPRMVTPPPPAKPAPMAPPPALPPLTINSFSLTLGVISPSVLFTGPLHKLSVNSASSSLATTPFFPSTPLFPALLSSSGPAVSPLNPTEPTPGKRITAPPPSTLTTTAAARVSTPASPSPSPSSASSSPALTPATPVAPTATPQWQPLFFAFAHSKLYGFKSSLVEEPVCMVFDLKAMEVDLSVQAVPNNEDGGVDTIFTLKGVNRSVDPPAKRYWVLRTSDANDARMWEFMLTKFVKRWTAIPATPPISPLMLRVPSSPSLSTLGNNAQNSPVSMFVENPSNCLSVQTGGIAMGPRSQSHHSSSHSRTQSFDTAFTAPFQNLSNNSPSPSSAPAISTAAKFSHKRSSTFPSTPTIPSPSYRASLHQSPAPTSTASTAVATLPYFDFADAPPRQSLDSIATVHSESGTLATPVGSKLSAYTKIFSKPKSMASLKSFKKKTGA
ncbi:hypothetical protein HDU97_007773 [Phlyctochytrium planicorne]|nr:hypothetical protein HDU97_007773 [Phlyctochytrium planicorne]